MTDAEAFKHIIDTAERFAASVVDAVPETDDLHEFMVKAGANIMALMIASKSDAIGIVGPTAITGLALLLKRKELVDKFTLINATNTKEA